ncbi:uncharacterized protein HMPREF1541_08088 [Cyphellophora europaea CBS 101466]|uniref:Uncharacterized protein n=1 Tax=Cyphellophora europaea (strain CBS 101466) TaxID=1220924 RepID=W2RN15_CYPE1|nr:uncharacterized protein HMPREF1541_08088 [Cyphellophora europaea CBS 101466]ETN37098.1 hypothetical protein HMPREF1541_08088 [Cyphellophora europaea CBS 101466]
MAAVTGSNKPARRRGKRNKKGGRPAAGNQRDTNISATTMTNSNATHIQPFQRYNAGHAAAIAAIRCPGETISHNTHYGAVPFRQNNVPAQRSTEAQRPTQGGSGLSNTHESMSDSNCGDATSSASGGRSCDVGNDNEVEMEWT